MKRADIQVIINTTFGVFLGQYVGNEERLCNESHTEIGARKVPIQKLGGWMKGRRADFSKSSNHRKKRTDG